MGMPASTRNAIIELIREHGPLSAAEITDLLKMNRVTVSSCIGAAREKYGTKFFRIADYGRQQGKGGREIPIYGLGPRSDVRPPQLGDQARKESQKRYVDKMRATINAKNRLRRNKGVPINPFQQLIPKSLRGAASTNSLSG